jgi:outer membrane protein TolC
MSRYIREAQLRAQMLILVSVFSATLALTADDAAAASGPAAGAANAAPDSAPAASSQAMDLRSAVERALTASPALTGAWDSLRAAEARRDVALRQYAPSAVASAGYTHSSLVDPGIISLPFGPPGTSIALPSPLQDSTSFRLALQQPLYTGGRIVAGVAAASASADSVHADAATRRRTVAAAAEQAWWYLVLAVQSEKTVVENLAAVTAHRIDAERRLSQGIGTKSQLLTWEMQEVEAGVRRRAATTDLAAARARLNIMMGLPWNAATAVILPAAPDIGPDPSDTSALSDSAGDGLLDKALVLRPEMAAARARVSIQEASEAQARASLLPSVYLTGSMTYADPNPKAFPQRSGFEFLWDLGLVASFDIGRVPAALAQIEDARAQAAQARDALGQTRDSLTLELVQARFDLEKARDRYISSAAAVNLAQENLRVQSDRYSAGIALASELADAEASLLSAKLDRTRSRVAWELARAALRDAAGGNAASQIGEK